MSIIVPGTAVKFRTRVDVPAELRGLTGTIDGPLGQHYRVRLDSPDRGLALAEADWLLLPGEVEEPDALSDALMKLPRKVRKDRPLHKWVVPAFIAGLVLLMLLMAGAMYCTADQACSASKREFACNTLAVVGVECAQP